MTQEGTSSLPVIQNDCFQWLHLWKFPCEPKIKQFLWCLAHDSLPLRMNIKRMGIKDVDTRCPVTSCAGRRRLLLLRALPWPDDSQPAGLQQEGRLIGFEFVLGWMGASTAG
jgi:hypothetical protein